MKANPGGQIDLKEIIGRDKIIEQIWETLEQQSIRMNAERRIGKTSIIKKLGAEPRKGWAPIYQDLEQYHTAAEFAVAVYREVGQFLSARQRTARRAMDLLKSIGGIEVGGLIKLPSLSRETPWKDILSSSIQDLADEHSNLNDRLLFLWDEVPFMLANIKNHEGESVAMEVLDILRGLRQSCDIRMILTGSIGLHHVISSLKLKGYANSPVNDTLAVTIPPLGHEYACELASKLIEGEHILSESHQHLVETIAHLSDGFPFYIHHIVKALKQSGLEGTPDAAEQIVSQQLLDANDPWELKHYSDRIPTYYGKDNEKAVLGILDGVADRTKAISVNELLAELKSTGTLDDREQLVNLLRLTEQDHYLSRNRDGHYQFQFPLLQRWWKLSRGL
ncbi:MAG: hypothetical protein ACC700_13075 [Anaerolineales bacterium]